VTYDYDANELKQYKEAKERVLFDGFEIEKYESGIFYISVMTDKESNLKDVFIRDVLATNEHGEFIFNRNKTIEDLVKYNLKLSESAKNKLT